ncbi:hypothetical protein JNM05_14485 [bacterium]|nr:hypothetical protein [bacterium]
MIDHSKLVLEKIVLELRFPSGFLFFDNCGKVCKKIVQYYPNIEFQKINVDGTQFTLNEKFLGCSISHTNLAIAQEFPLKLDDFEELSETVSSILIKEFEIESFARIGNRFFYTYPSENRSKSQELIKETSIINFDSDKFKIFGDEVTGVNVTLNFKDKDIGTNLIINDFSERRLQSATHPLIKSIEPTKFYKGGIQIDLDRYTLKPLSSGQLSCRELIKNNKKESERSIELLFKSK